MTNHVLKTAPEFFFAVKSGAKNFEVRKDDRAFQTGDTVECVYYDLVHADRDWRDLLIYGDEIKQRAQSAFSPPFQPPLVNGVRQEPRDISPVRKRITFILRGGQYGVEAGHVVLGLADIE